MSTVDQLVHVPADRRGDHVGDPRGCSMASPATATQRGRKAARAVSAAPKPPRNGEFDWNAFNPKIYHAHNYRTLRDDDRQIVEHMRDFFGDTQFPPSARALDIGPGANLYPSLSLMPLCAAVDLIEYSTANIAWLRRQQAWLRRFDRSGRSWAPFWNLLGEHASYEQYVREHTPLEVFRRKAHIVQGSIFDLKRARWDAGTMFFVACSLSGDRGEFFRAVGRFLEALKPRAPFAAAFMTGSDGYEIEDRRFPSFPVTEDDVQRALQTHARDVRIIPIESDLRPNVGMVLTTGFRR
jgi:hypothetical protein